MCLFPYSTVAGARAIIDSHDAISVLEATVVEDRSYNWGGVESEASTFVRMLSLCTSVRVPLTDILDSSPESPFERLRSSGGSFLWSSFRGGTRATPRG